MIPRKHVAEINSSGRTRNDDEATPSISRRFAGRAELRIAGLPRDHCACELQLVARS